jgi:hypothetical protein
MGDSGLETVSVEQDGRVLTGVGADRADLEQVMERHAPAEEPAKPESVTTEIAQPVEAKKPRGQSRFDQLTGEREAAKREADAAKAEAADLRMKLEAAQKTREAAPAAIPAPEAARAAVPAPTRAKPTEAEVGTKYQTYGDFVDDLTDWKSEQRAQTTDIDAQIRRSIEADRASRSREDRLVNARTRALTVYPDFDAVMSSPHMNANNWSLEKIAAIEALAEMEHVHYALGKDPSLAEKLRVEPNLAVFGMELAKLIPAAAVASPASTAHAGTSMAPPPFQPVGSGSKTTVPPSAELASKGFDFDKSGYREKRAAERGLRRMK